MQIVVIILLERGGGCSEWPEKLASVGGTKMRQCNATKQ